MIRRIRLDDGVYIHEDDLRGLRIPDSWDGDTITAAIVEIESFLDYEEQTGRLDDRTREGLVIALEVLADVRSAYTAVLDRGRGLSTPADAWEADRG